MTSKRIRWRIRSAVTILLALLALVNISQAAPEAALGTAFTYQGRLDSSGSPVNANCDFQFGLWDAASGGGQIGSTVTKTNVAVSEGLFTVQLDFGASAFAGDSRFLAVAVRCPASGGSYTNLSPRQQLTAVPYALNARSAPWSGLSGVPAGFADGVDNDTTSFWSLTGNSGTTPGTHFVGTTDNQSLTLGVNGAAALRLSPNPSSPNLIGGYSGNSAKSGVAGAVIGGGGMSGTTNRVTDHLGVVVGGYNNQAGNDNGDLNDAYYAFVGGGGSNTASAPYAVIAGGWGHTASGSATAIGGGEANTAAADWSTIGGGRDNVVSGIGYSTVSGGWTNTASGYVAVIAGGYNNTASGDRSIVSGGYSNTASNTYATISGGNNNTANAINTTIGGGWANQAVSSYGTIPGGTKARTEHYGELAYASGAFADIGDAQTSLYLLRNTTTDATPTPLFLDGSSERLTVAQDRALAFDILVVASGPTGGNVAGYQIQGLVQNFNGTVRFVGSPTVTVLGEDVAAWDAAVTVNNTDDALDINVTGVNGVTIRWVASVRTVEVRFP